MPCAPGQGRRCGDPEGRPEALAGPPEDLGLDRVGDPSCRKGCPGTAWPRRIRFAKTRGRFLGANPGSSQCGMLPRSQLQVFEGVTHVAYLLGPSPESKDVFEEVVAFFDTHLARKVVPAAPPSPLSWPSPLYPIMSSIGPTGRVAIQDLPGLAAAVEKFCRLPSNLFLWRHLSPCRYWIVEHCFNRTAIFAQNRLYAVAM